MKQIWEDDFNNLYRDVEDMQNHCKYLESENNQLQSNWNSLREYVEKRIQDCKRYYPCCSEEFQHLLDKMNELESGGKD